MSDAWVVRRQSRCGYDADAFDGNICFILLHTHDSLHCDIQLRPHQLFYGGSEVFHCAAFHVAKAWVFCSDVVRLNHNGISEVVSVLFCL